MIAGRVDVDADEVPEIDFTYFITSNWAAELILATTRHRVTDSASTLGDVDLGKVSLLPPILTLQYHFRPDAKYRPYVGAGINYTIFYDEKAPGTTVTAISYEDNFGFACKPGSTSVSTKAGRNRSLKPWTGDSGFIVQIESRPTGGLVTCFAMRYRRLHGGSRRGFWRRSDAGRG